MKKLYIFDTTLRDGEQSLARTLDVREKLEIARQLVHLGVDIIEAGFPASSPGDFEAVQVIAREVRGVSVCGLTRAVSDDIRQCARALEGAEHPRIHTGIGVSPSHMADKLGLTPEAVAQKAEAAVRLARSYVGDVEFYAEDAFRSDRQFLAAVISRVIKAGATVVNIPDTVGYATPWEYGELIAYLMEHVENIDRAVVSVHCHNDLGMATANSIAGVMGGARQVEGTINGIGERAGNAALEEVIMALHAKRYAMDLDLSINTREILPSSQMIAKITGVPVADHKAIVGRNAFNHASGIHQDGVLKSRETYEIINPEIIGAEKGNIVLTARSGRHALKYRLEGMGFSVRAEEIDGIYTRFLHLADRKKTVTDEDLKTLIPQ